MTTQELKQQIDKVLGNSIRCLLPSYWWKRLFNQVADRIDEVEQSTSKLIESKVEEVKMPIVESVDELEKLKLAKGRVAAVEKTGEPATVKISDCYLSFNFEEDWDKYTIVKGVEEKDVIIDKDVDASVIFSASKENIDKDALQVCAISGIFYYIKLADGESRVTSLEYVNKALSSGKYRAIDYLHDPDDCFIDDYFTFYSEKPQPSLYIKGDSWERLAKEYAVSSEEELNALSVENGTIAKVAYDYEVRSYRNTKISNSTDKDFDRVVGLDVLSVPSSEFAIPIYAQELEANNKRISVSCYGTGRIDGVIMRREGNVIYQEEVYNLARDYSINAYGVKRFNELLRSMDCLLEHPSYVSEEGYTLIDSALRFHIAVPVVSNAYIKGETWTRLLKDGDVVGGESSGKVDRVIYGFNTDLTAEHVESNKETYRLFSEGKASITILAGGVFFFTPNRYYHYNDSFVFVFVYDAYQCGIILNEDGTVEYESDLIVDSELSDTSENAVQNKVIKAYVDEKVANAITTTLNTEV